MSPDICPLCGENALMTNQGEFRFVPPPNIPGGVIIVPNATWRECAACHERIIPHALNQALDQEEEQRLKPRPNAEIHPAFEKTKVPVAAG